MKKLLSISLAIIMLALMLTSCGNTSDDSDIFIPIRTGSAINYETVHAGIGTLKEQVTLDGSFTTPYRTELMFTHIGGTIATIEVHQDQEVNEGDIIATLRDDELEEELKVQQIKLDSARSTYETLQAQHASADDIEFARIAYDLEQMEYDNLAEMREFLILRAPFSGRITSLGNYNVGSYINRYATFCTISDSSKVRLTVGDYRGQLSNISFGTKVIIDQGTLAHTTGKVVDTVTTEIYVRNEGFGGGMMMTVTSYIIQPDDESIEFLDLGGIQVTFTTLRRDDAIIVPVEAIFEATDDITNLTGNFVNVLVDGIKIQTAVTVGIITSDGRAEIISGLDGTETLILR